MRKSNSARTTVLTLVLGLATASCVTRGTSEGPTSTAEKVKRGQYLVTVGGCNDCHTALKLGPNGPEPDMTRMLSGHPQHLSMPPVTTSSEPWAWTGAITNTAFAGPWGVSYSTLRPTRTPESESGRLTQNKSNLTIKKCSCLMMT